MHNADLPISGIFPRNMELGWPESRQFTATWEGIMSDLGMEEAEKLLGQDAA